MLRCEGIPKTIGSVYENSVENQIRNGNYRDLGYNREKVVDKGKVKGYKLSIPQNVKLFESAYSGGRNETYLYGIHKGNVYDYDLRSAYSSVLSITPSWDMKKMTTFTNPNELYLFVREQPLAVGYVNIRFTFKEGTLYPLIPVKHDGGLYFSLSGSSICTLQEFLVAYTQLTECEMVAVAYPVKSPDSEISRFTLWLKEEREKAKSKGDKFTNNILKLILNSGYGKFTQGISGNKSLNLRLSTKDRVIYTPIPHSSIYNPMIASFITGMVRAVVGEYLFYCGMRGYKLGCVTTDGFVVFHQFDESELKGVGTLSRHFTTLQDSDSLLEVKHSGEDFLGIKTRGYCFIHGDNPLVATTGISLRGMTDIERRDFVLGEFLNLTPFKDTKYTQSTLPSIREWILEGAEPVNKTELRSYNFDYDLKRKPKDIQSIEGRPSFDTAPFESIEEIKLWREYYADFKRGKRDGNKQIGVKNKLQDVQSIREFELYVKLRGLKLQSLKRIDERTLLRIFASLLHRLKGWGIKKISKNLGLPISTIRTWIKKYPISDSDLTILGVHLVSLYIPFSALGAPSPELRQEVLKLWTAWIKNNGDKASEEINIKSHKKELERDLVKLIKDGSEDIQNQFFDKELFEDERKDRHI